MPDLPPFLTRERHLLHHRDQPHGPKHQHLLRLAGGHSKYPWGTPTAARVPVDPNLRAVQLPGVLEPKRAPHLRVQRLFKPVRREQLRQVPADRLQRLVRDRPQGLCRTADSPCQPANSRASSALHDSHADHLPTDRADHALIHGLLRTVHAGTTGLGHVRYLDQQVPDLRQGGAREPDCTGGGQGPWGAQQGPSGIYKIRCDARGGQVLLLHVHGRLPQRRGSRKERLAVLLLGHVRAINKRCGHRGHLSARSGRGLRGQILRRHRPNQCPVWILRPLTRSLDPAHPGLRYLLSLLSSNRT